MVGYHPIGHHIYNLRRPKLDAETGITMLGEKTFFMKCRVMAGQADLLKNQHNLEDFKWLSKEEIAQYVIPQYYSHIKNMLPDR